MPALIREAPAAVIQPNNAVMAVNAQPLTRIAPMAKLPIASPPATNTWVITSPSVATASPIRVLGANMAAAPKQLMAEMPKMIANVMPTASRATPALWRFLALARMFSTGVGSGFRAKNCRAQAEPLPPAARAAFSACLWPSRTARPAALMP